MTTESAKAKGISSFWVLVMILPITGFGIWFAIDHSNSQYRQQLETKFNEALRISSRQFSYSINKSVCGFRGFVEPTLKSYRAAAKDPTLSPSARKRNDLRIHTTQQFLDSQVTVPPDFDCRKLPQKAPTP